MRVLIAMAALGLALAAANVPETAPIETYKPAERRHWAFQPREQVTPPALPAEAQVWVKTPVDAFIWQALDKAGLRPAPEADRETLIRRVTFDLHGLPPTPEEIDAFIADRSPDAWEKLVDRLLASPRFGQQWGRHWLDVVRFAESDGFEYDTHRPDAWRYRDYVIDSFNSDKPYNQFVVEQLAGDEIDPDNDVYRVASGFNRLGALRKNAGNQEVASSRVEVLTEMTNIVGASFLGVTLGCARCHDHKFDPIRHSDYYRIQGYFAQTQYHDISLATAEEAEAWEAKAQPVRDKMRDVRRQMRKASDDEKVQLEMELEKLEDQIPPPLPALYAVRNEADKVTPIHILARGDYQQKGARVGMRPLGVLLPDDTPELPVETERPRQRLAEWIADPAHPLTARVIVNRLWHYHFGRGIVGTPNDFGRMGTRPSHPDLLDWLANQLVEGGWRMKPIHRLILLSSAYRQSSRSPLEQQAMEKDSGNTLLWKFSRRRLEAEELRDAMLAVSGQLNAKAGGPSVLVPIEEELVKLLKKPELWVTTKDPAEYDRRSLYLIYKRNLRLPFMEVFDQPDMQLSCPRREQSTHAPQALELLNGELSNRLAKALAERLLAERDSTAERIDHAWRLATGRLASPAEKAAATRFLAGAEDNPRKWKEFALAVLNLNPFLYVN